MKLSEAAAAKHGAIDEALERGDNVFLAKEAKEAREGLEAALRVMEMFSEKSGSPKPPSEHTITAMRDVALAAIDLAKSFAPKPL